MRYGRIITFRVPLDLYHRLKHAIEVSGMSQSQIIRNALDYYLRKHKYLDVKINKRRVRL